MHGAMPVGGHWSGHSGAIERCWPAPAMLPDHLISAPRLRRGGGRSARGACDAGPSAQGYGCADATVNQGTL